MNATWELFVGFEKVQTCCNIASTIHWLIIGLAKSQSDHGGNKIARARLIGGSRLGHPGWSKSSDIFASRLHSLFLCHFMGNNGPDGSGRARDPSRQPASPGAWTGPPDGKQMHCVG